MKQVERWITYDGYEHRDFDAALFYLAEKRGHIITKLAHKLVAGDGKYSSTLAVLDETIDALAEELVKINADREIREY